MKIEITLTEVTQNDLSTIKDCLEHLLDNNKVSQQTIDPLYGIDREAYRHLND